MPFPTITPDALVEEFELFFDWEERYQYLIELGNAMVPFPVELQCEENRVQGCLSTVWLVCHESKDDPRKLVYSADSDSQLVKGLVAILVQLYNQKTPEDIMGLDIVDVFARIELTQHLSRSRANGLHSMIARIKTMAINHASPQTQ
ncbi:MAG: SufE family protein [Planctomycetaceae bacterium]|jgi:cysteine desulfuration protein SufE|nr:SufE family protein [Planctomycetaceae bacterium]